MNVRGRVRAVAVEPGMTGASLVIWAQTEDGRLIKLDMSTPPTVLGDAEEMAIGA